MKLIVAVNNLGYIGKDGGMLWRSPDDLKHFKALTMGQKLLVGRKTFDGLPPLRGRYLIVVGTGYHTLEEALALKPDWVIGGGQIYEQTMNLCDELHISIIDNDDEGDTKFPDHAFVGQINYYNFTTV